MTGKSKSHYSQGKVVWADGKLDVVEGAGRYIDRPLFPVVYEAVKKLAEHRAPSPVPRRVRLVSRSPQPVGRPIGDGSKPSKSRRNAVLPWPLALEAYLEPGRETVPAFFLSPRTSPYCPAMRRRPKATDKPAAGKIGKKPARPKLPPREAQAWLLRCAPGLARLLIKEMRLPPAWSSGAPKC